MTSAHPVGRALLLACAGLLWAAAATAQNAPVPGDSAREIFNDVFLGQPAPGAFVVLSEGIVYRIEIEPAAATVSVRFARRPGMGPLFLVPLGGDAGAAGGAAYLMVPRLSGEYRLDVATDGDEPVRVRIRVDPKENARWARMREETRNQRPAGVSLRAVWFGPFRSMQTSAYNPAQTAAGAGWEACVAVLPHGSWAKGGPLGGCLLSLTALRRARTAGDVLFIGIAPRFEFWARPGGASLAGEFQIAIGQTTSGPGMAVNYFVFAGGALLAFPLPVAERRLFGELVLGVASVNGSVDAAGSRVHAVPKVAAGLKLAL